MGGAIAAVENGYYLKEMADGMYKYQKEVESGERIIIGVNKDELTEELPIEIFAGDPEAERRQVERLTKLKEERDNELVRNALGELRVAAKEKAVKNNTNIVAPILKAVKAYAPSGICSVLRDVFGNMSQVDISEAM